MQSDMNNIIPKERSERVSNKNYFIIYIFKKEFVKIK